MVPFTGDGVRGDGLFRFGDGSCLKQGDGAGELNLVDSRKLFRSESELRRLRLEALEAAYPHAQEIAASIASRRTRTSALSDLSNFLQSTKFNNPAPAP